MTPSHNFDLNQRMPLRDSERVHNSDTDAVGCFLLIVGMVVLPLAVKAGLSWYLNR